MCTWRRKEWILRKEEKENQIYIYLRELLSVNSRHYSEESSLYRNVSMSQSSRACCMETKCNASIMVDMKDASIRFLEKIIFWSFMADASTATAAVRILPNNKVYRQLFDAQVIHCKTKFLSFFKTIFSGTTQSCVQSSSRSSSCWTSSSENSSGCHAFSSKYSTTW